MDALREFLLKTGHKPVDVGVPGAEPFWEFPGRGALPAAAALDAVVVELLTARAAMAASPKRFYRTSEFWLVLAGTGGAVTALLSELSTVATPGWQTALLGLAGTVIPVIYAMVRMNAKAVALAEQKVLTSGGVVPGPSNNPG